MKIVPKYYQYIFYKADGRVTLGCAVARTPANADKQIVEPEDAVVLANLAAGIEVSKRGTATVSPSEILEFLDSHDAKS